MSIHSHLPYDHSASHARVPAGGINLIASIDSISEAQVTASFFGSTKALHGEVATTTAETSTHNHSNQQYSITAVTTSTGAIAERYAYSAYGEPTICDASGSAIGSSAINNRYSYTGREWDSTVGLYHFRARWMSPKSGRFLGRDPIGYRGSPWDLYEFLGTRTLQTIDPSGKSCSQANPIVCVIQCALEASQVDPEQSIIYFGACVAVRCFGYRPNPPQPQPPQQPGPQPPVQNPPKPKCVSISDYDGSNSPGQILTPPVWVPNAQPGQHGTWPDDSKGWALCTAGCPICNKKVTPCEDCCESCVPHDPTASGLENIKRDKMRTACRLKCASQLNG